MSASDKREKPREQFIRMMADLRAGLIDVIVASEFTRLYRHSHEEGRSKTRNTGEPYYYDAREDARRNEERWIGDTYRSRDTLNDR